jgi:two-component sensor histidine kinase
MPARWSLRTKLAVAVTVAVLPALALSAWHAVEEQRNVDIRKSEAVAATAELAAARYRELIEGSRRLLEAACAESAVRRSADPDAAPADINRCESYLTSVLEKFPKEYSLALVTDAQGVARCASLPTAVGMGFSDREIFRLVRDTKAFAMGAQVASRVVPRTVIPAALPLLQDGAFRGMCAVDISLTTVGDLVTPVRAAEHVAVALVDRGGGSIGGDPLATRALPAAARLAAAIVGGQTAFRDYGQDGSFYEFHILPLASNSLFVVTAVGVTDGWPALAGTWGGFAAVVLALAGALLAVWLGADRWCVRPLRAIQNFADRVARGEDIEFARQSTWGRELASMGEGVQAMAEAIASREAELRAGLEQRDHMLREIHHRVKNNLQMISSLLNLQAGEIRSPRIRRFFGDAQNRVLTLSILHRHLYERSSWALVDFQQFISDLVRQISVGRRAPDRLQPRYHIRAPIMAVGPDIAIPIGLIVTEAVSSALDRRFDGVAMPEIRIEAADKAGMVELVVEDNGAGPGGSIRPDARSGFGLTLIRGLAMQLGGEAAISSRDGGGARVSVTFPMPEETEASA